MINKLTRLIIKGGVLSPAELKLICQSAEDLGSDVISFGSRQDILFPDDLNNDNTEKIEGFQVVNPIKNNTENIMSSYVSADIFPNTPWLTGDKYLYVLEQFRNEHHLKINITDPKQRLVPLFTGHLNFIASEQEDYWYLYIRLPFWKKMEAYPVLIYSWDIAKVANVIENLLKEEPESVDMIFDLVNDAIQTNNITIDKPLHIPFHPFPYYEGMNRIGSDKYWLGLYWRNNRYDLKFLKAMCDLCSDCKIGKISITPWKSFIVKDIPRTAKLHWEKFLGKHGINVRHSMLELNWHLPVANDDALKLKKYLVDYFDTNDISTYGLTFGITEYTRKAYYFTSVVIEKNTPPTGLKDFKIRDTYNLLYAKNFDPNTREYIVHVQEVDKAELPSLLLELSRLYFEQLGSESTSLEPLEVVEEEIEYEVYQCKDCLTVYNQTYGDITQNIEPNTAFEDLSDNYVCSLCEAPKSNFEKKTFTKKLS
ncbi:rubredoxin [Winogradskyella endarachnes]|uniref:Rubredoxin n=1 Tax=Winogradskyella endarachnes TaxID=2681965 RepID=A0A6L6UAD0_9FLAO|nr:rubredoxin [Winogradskyella endarachnes]MUU79148.1 rubredoxin [Winogradskyella endarachnes]